MKDYTKKKTADVVVSAKIPEALKKELLKRKLNISMICRDALAQAVQKK